MKKNRLIIFNSVALLLFLFFSVFTGLFLLLGTRFSAWIFVIAILPAVMALIFLNIILPIVRPRRILFIIYPLMEITAKLLRVDFDKFRREFIEYSNISMLRKLTKNKTAKDANILILLPHCLQSSECLYKVTWDKLDNCRLCGKCCIPEFLKIKKDYELNVVVVTGGSAAREVVKNNKPQLIIAVACENDLVSGLREVSEIPVLAVLNDRPFGPCRDTSVDIEIIRHYLDSL